MEKKESNNNNQPTKGRRAARKLKQAKIEKREERIRRCAAQGDGTCDIWSSSSHSLAGLGTFRLG